MIEHQEEFLPADTAILIIHVINCWGAAWLRRNTDGNVDLCRNFPDFSGPLPDSSGYSLANEILNNGFDSGSMAAETEPVAASAAIVPERRRKSRRLLT